MDGATMTCSPLDLSKLALMNSKKTGVWCWHFQNVLCRCQWPDAATAKLPNSPFLGNSRIQGEAIPGVGSPEYDSFGAYGVVRHDVLLESGSMGLYAGSDHVCFSESLSVDV